MTQTTCTACGKSFPRAKAFTSWGRTYCSPSCFNKSVGTRSTIRTAPAVVGYQQPAPLPNPSPKASTAKPTIVLPRTGGCGTCGKAR